MKMIIPKMIIDHFKNFFHPCSFVWENNFKSEEPTRAPVNELESGAIKKPIIIIKKEIIKSIIVKINPTIFTP
ncbi:hypothetical protein ACJA29_00745 [Metamycoplasma sualvi]|uniref:hypothetical protein n=1 Tax=Metamycoplasma sualvi TaxID=2125 RepID=UPI003873AA50